MRFEDPLEAQCEVCETKSLLPVASLLGLTARCDVCGSKLTELGFRMRSIIDEWHLFVTIVDLVLILESETGTGLSDDEIDRVKTLRDLKAALLAHLTGQGDAEHRAEGLIRGAVARLGCIADSRLDFDAPMLEALYPDRFSREPSLLESGPRSGT